jgi:general secretion pathway protein G
MAGKAVETGSRFSWNCFCKRRSAGTSLIEMITVLAILGILSAMAFPYARKSIQRDKEFALRATLREVRNAIDRFHADWETAQGAGGFSRAASPDGYPRTLEVLVQGIKGGGASGRRRRYLRSLPKNPFAPEKSFKEQWRLIGYQDDPKSALRRSKDIYDIRANTQRIALDGTAYADW